MSTRPVKPSGATSSRESAWAKPISKIHVTDVPAGAVSINVDGRQVVGALQGFGQMWQKTYRVQLPGIGLTPEQVMQIWKDEFPQFQPPASRFYPSMAGVKPGSLIFINLQLPVFAGLPNMIRVDSGVLVLYADEVMFTVMTPEGFPVSGWNTFSVSSEDGSIVAQIQSMERATDPIYEIGNILMGGSRRQEQNWIHVLTKLAERFGVQGKVEMDVVLVDSRRQWSQAKNVWKNASIRTFLYRLAVPVRQARRLFNGRKN